MSMWWTTVVVMVLRRPRRDDRGDVPGWVLVTLMTAGIVMALWVVAEPKLASLLGGALDVAGDPNGK
jgi:hypothetical protein